MDDEVSRHDTDKRVVRTKKAIKTALLSLMEKKDVAEITVIELTQAADINRRTFYTHYRGVTDILDEIEEDIVYDMRRLAERIYPDAPRENVYNMFKGLDELIFGKFDYYFRVVSVETRGALVRRLKDVFSAMTCMVLKQLREKNVENAEAISTFIVGGFFNSYLGWYKSGGKNRESFEETAALVGRMVELCVNMTDEKGT